MNKLILILHIILCLLITTKISAQKSAKANKLANNGYLKLQAGNLEEGEELLLEAISEDSTLVKPYNVLSQLYASQLKVDECIAINEKNCRINYFIDAQTLYNLGVAYLIFGKYDEAYKSFEKYLKNTNVRGTARNKGNYLVKKAEYCVQAVASPVPFVPENLGDNINSEYSEYLPSITADNLTMLFTRRIPMEEKNEWGFFYHEDFFRSDKNEGEWTKAENLGEPMNTTGNEGAQTFSPDGQFIFFTSCTRDDRYGDCDLYYANKSGDKWSAPVNLGRTVNSQYRESEPSFSSDGKTLYFVSDRPGGIGGFDIWRTELSSMGYWKSPVNLGETINTEGKEIAPFIHPDNQTLYFSSNAHMGMGGQDIFYSRRDEKGKWQEPENIGYPINTYTDDFDLVVNPDGSKAYYSSSMEGGYGEQDIYMFDLYEAARPVPVTFMKGTVYDIFTKEKLSAKFELINIETGEVVVQSWSNRENGEFLVCLPANRDYALNVSKEGYMFHSENFSLTNNNTDSKPYKMDVELSPIKTGQKVVLKNIFFETASFELKPESKAELNKLVNFLRSNPDLKIRINGHTDNVGSDSDNMTLSDNRAKSVTEYLTENNISANRLSHKGYGETEPVADNETEEGRAENRRTEFEIVD